MHQELTNNLAAAGVNPHFQSKLDEVKLFTDQHIRPYAGAFEKAGGFPDQLVKEMAERGFLGACLPQEYGGLGMDPVTYGLFTEELGKGCCSVRSLITVHSSLVGETLVRWGTGAQKQEWLEAMATGRKLAAFALSEPTTGSDARNVQTTYVRKNGAFCLNGTKKWITCAAIADVLLVIAACEDRVSAFLVDTDAPGVEIVPIQGMMAGKASYMAEIHLKEVMIPEDRLLGVEGGGFSYIVNTALDHGRYSIAWAGVAIAQEAIDAMVRYSRQRSQFGKKIYNHQLIQGLIGDATTQTHAARALCISAGRLRAERHENAVIETNMAKYFSSGVAVKVAADAVQVHGANGFSEEYPVERLYREAKVLEVIEGTSQLQQEIIAQFALKEYYKTK